MSSVKRVAVVYNEVVAFHDNNLWGLSDKVEKGKYEYPNEVDKVPV